MSFTFSDYAHENFANFANENYLLQLSDNIDETDLKDSVFATMVKIVRSIDSNSSQTKKDWITDMVEMVSLYKVQNPPIFTVEKGENFILKVNLEEDQDFSGYKILGRKADDFTALTSVTKDGMTYDQASSQYIRFEDYAQAENDFIKGLFLLELPNQSGEASGDATTLITDFYIYCSDNIDELDS